MNFSKDLNLVRKEMLEYSVEAKTSYHKRNDLSRGTLPIDSTDLAQSSQDSISMSSAKSREFPQSCQIRGYHVDNSLQANINKRLSRR